MLRKVEYREIINSLKHTNQLSFDNQKMQFVAESGDIKAKIGKDLLIKHIIKN